MLGSCRLELWLVFCQAVSYRFCVAHILSTKDIPAGNIRFLLPGGYLPLTLVNSPSSEHKGAVLQAWSLPFSPNLPSSCCDLFFFVLFLNHVSLPTFWFLLFPDTRTKNNNNNPPGHTRLKETLFPPLCWKSWWSQSEVTDFS